MAWHVLEPSSVLKWGWALDAICEHLEAVTRGEIRRLVINVPPGTMKSMLTSVLWPAWEWGPKEMAAKRFLSTAHKQDLAVRDSTNCRRLITSEWYQSLWQVILTGDQNAKTKFGNTKTGIRECSAFNSLTGLRADRVILDDPHSVDDANSPIKIAADVRTFKEAVPTRVNNEQSAIVIIMQRLAVGDVSDIALSLGYEHLLIPMRFEKHRSKYVVGKGDPRSVVGELMFQERFSEKEVVELETSMGSQTAAGQLQQRPVAREGNLFKEAWLKYYRHSNSIGAWLQIVQSWDTANSRKLKNAPSVCTTWVKTYNGNYLLDVYREHVEFPDLLKAMAALAFKYKPHAILVENKASGQQALQTFAAMTPEQWKLLCEQLGLAHVPQMNLIPVQPHGDKYSRAVGATGPFESGRTFLPEEAPWLAAYKEELLSFPSSAYADQVDSTSQVMDYLNRHVIGYTVSTR
jgi:predicted phage terminase large subunit-like protein